MHLRPATPADLPRCATIWNDAFVDDELARYLAPYAADHPLSNRQFRLAKVRDHYYAPNSWTFVCVSDSNDSVAAKDEILGFANWVRSSSKEDAASDPWKRSLGPLEQVERWLRWAEFKYETVLRVNPAISWVNSDRFAQNVAASTAFKAVRGSTHWYVSGLAVAPEHQRRGVATMLLQWGLGHAASETEQRVAVGKAPVPVGLIASQPGLPMYRKMGMKVVGWADDSFFAYDEGVGAKGGSEMLWDPTGYWTEDVAYEGPMKRGVVEAVYKTRDS